MPFATGDAQIYYESLGDTSQPTVVLIEGAGAQMLGWHQDFCQLLLDTGFHVARMDNRDVGLSRKFGGPEHIDGGYGIEDMASDVIAVLDHLGMERAHLVGRSMGAIIAQVVALEHPARVASQTWISSIPSQEPAYILQDATESLTAAPVRLTRAQAIAFAVAMATPSPGETYPPDIEWAKQAAAEAYDRCYAPEGMHRQWAALMRAPDRLERLRQVAIPTALIHGRNDPVLHWQASADTAAAVPDAELHVYSGMGHGLPRALWPDVIATIRRTASKA